MAIGGAVVNVCVLNEEDEEIEKWRNGRLVSGEEKDKQKVCK